MWLTFASVALTFPKNCKWSSITEISNMYVSLLCCAVMPTRYLTSVSIDSCQATHLWAGSAVDCRDGAQRRAHLCEALKWWKDPAGKQNFSEPCISATGLFQHTRNDSSWQRSICWQRPLLQKKGRASSLLSMSELLTVNCGSINIKTNGFLKMEHRMKNKPKGYLKTQFIYLFILSWPFMTLRCKSVTIAQKVL